MSDAPNCPICKSSAEISEPRDFDGLHWNCPRCGRFDVTGSIEDRLRSDTTFRREVVSGWVRDQNDVGITPSIDSNSFANLVNLNKPSTTSRAERLLVFAANSTSSLGEHLGLPNDDIVARTYSKNEKEVYFLRNYLIEKGLIEMPSSSSLGRVTVQGFAAAEELTAQRKSTSQCFVAMWFSEKLKPAFANGFDPGIRSAGFEPFRIDAKEHVNKIDDEIIAEIRRSAFLVADFTGHRGGVYFEAGFAMGLGLPVIWTCQKEDIEDLHFDIRQYNCIDWTEPQDLSERLKNRIVALLGGGPGIN